MRPSAKPGLHKVFAQLVDGERHEVAAGATTTTAPASVVKKMCPSAATGEAKCGQARPSTVPA